MILVEDKPIVLNLIQILDQITAWITECDADDLATLVGETFGGKCFTANGEIFEFYPDENYCGAFD